MENHRVGSGGRWNFSGTYSVEQADLLGSDGIGVIVDPKEGVPNRQAP